MLVEWLLGSSKVCGFLFIFFFETLCPPAEVCGAEAILLHLRTPWFSTEQFEEHHATCETPTVEKLVHIPLHVDSMGSPTPHLKAEGCVCS